MTAIQIRMSPVEATAPVASVAQEGVEFTGEFAVI
jgi:hypothetical protein